MESQDHFFCLSPRSSLEIEIQLNESSSFELERFSSSLSSHLNVGSTSILFKGSSSSSLMVDSSWIGLDGVEMRFDEVDIRFISQIQNDFISVSSGFLQISNSQLFLPSLSSSSNIFSTNGFSSLLLSNLTMDGEDNWIEGSIFFLILMKMKLFLL